MRVELGSLADPSPYKLPVRYVALPLIYVTTTMAVSTFYPHIVQ